MITKNEISSLNLSPTKKDFVQIWNELIEVASKITERWDPTSTNESDPGIVLLKVLAGIADKLNYNIDKNILEAFMPTAAQMESMQKLCELVGYDIKYYQSAETKVRISYTGNTSSSDERIEGFGLPVPKFTTITNADKDITFVTINQFPLYITNNTPWVEVPCIEGQISQCESMNDNNLITLSQFDDNNRYYLPETQIAENGIFVYNATTLNQSISDGEAWTQVSNLNTHAPGNRIYKFGYDSREGRPYLVFPDDVGSLIGDGLFIYFVRTSGLSGNISPRTLEVLEIPTDEAWANYSAEQFEVVNFDATANGANIESISAAYNNFKKTVGTFDTLVTCRDYMNKIYSLMDAGNSPYVSNILVTDIRSDINSAVTLCSFNEFGILYKEQPLLDPDTDKPLIDHFDLLLYPFKTFTQVSSGTKDLVTPYNNSFIYTEQRNDEIKAVLHDIKTCAHNFDTPSVGDLVAINNYLRLNALIATSARVSEAEAESILTNVKVALVNEFNSRNLDFGEEIPFESILSVIENADSRIKVVSLQEPTLLTTYSVKEQITEGVTSTYTSKEYGIASSASDFININNINYGYKYDNKTNESIDKAKEIYNKLVLRNILAGRAALFDYDETFIANNAEKPYTITKDITNDWLIKLDGGDSTANDIKTAIESILVQDILEDSGERILYDGGVSIKGFNGGILTIRFSLESSASITGRSVYTCNGYQCNIYETYEYDFVGDTPQPAPAVYRLTRGVSRSAPAANNGSNGIIDGVKKVEAVCEITSNTNTFKDITLAKNEVIKFRAPNLITTKTFPAYVYYRYEKGASSAASAATSAGREATAVTLNTFINNLFPGEDGKKEFLSGLCRTDTKNISTVICSKTGGTLDESDKLQGVFKTAMMLFHTNAAGKENITKSNIDKIFLSEGELRTYLESQPAAITQVTFYYYPLNISTLNTWSTYLRKSYTEKESKVLPGVTALWRLSSTYNYPTGRLVIFSGQKLFVLDGDHLANSDVGSDVYVCTDLGADSSSYTLPEKGDIELENGDKLYIHYTPSSTNEAGETVEAEPISVVYSGGDPNEPIILRPSGFTLMPSEDVHTQGTSWKKTDVTFTGYGNKNLFALSPNEQIELRSISKVVLNTPARFYKNFDNPGLENGTLTEYELKDGEYIFYTNQSTQEAAYYGSGSVISLKGGAYIPKTDGLKEVSQILEQGLHIIPWSSIVLLTDNKTVTVTEYQYITLVDGDTIDDITIYADHETTPSSYTINNTWKTCETATYTSAGAESPSKLPVIELSSGKGWEVCSRLELSTSPNYAQELRAISADNKPATSFTADGVALSIKFDTENTVIFTDNSGDTAVTTKFEYSISNGEVNLAYVDGDDTKEYSIGLTNGIPASVTYDSIRYDLSPGTPTVNSITELTDKVVVYTVTDVGEGPTIIIEPQETVKVDESGVTTEFEPVSIKLDTGVQSASGNFAIESTDDISSIADTTMHMKVFKEVTPALLELDSTADIITPISNKLSVPLDSSSESINNYWTKLDVGLAFHDTATGKPRAVSLNFMIPEDEDSGLFGVFSIYLDTSTELAADSIPKDDYRVFIDVPGELGAYNEVISIFNCKDNSGKDSWWRTEEDGYHGDQNRLYLRAGLNCIKVLKSCNLLIKAEEYASGNIIYDNLRLVKGLSTNGVNLKLIDFKKASIASEEDETVEPSAELLADELLNAINTLDTNHEFYYNVPVENSLAMEFDNNISTLSNPQTLYDINNINNGFVISKLDVAYLDSGLKIAKSSRY